MGFSQGLKPIVQQIDQETRFCFTIEQSRFIAARLIKSAYQDSLILRLESKNQKWQYMVVKKDSAISVLKEKNSLLLQVNKSNDRQLEALSKSLRSTNKKIKQNKFQKLLFGSGLLVITGILIAK